MLVGTLDIALAATYCTEMYIIAGKSRSFDARRDAERFLAASNGQGWKTAVGSSLAS